MDASVIVPAYNAAGTLAECLTALQQQSLLPERFEVIVVDDGSSDDTAGIAAQAGVRVIHQSNQGQAAARNTGVGQAHANIVVFTDADCAPAPAWLHEMLVPFSDPAISGSKGAYRTRQHALVARFVQVEYEERYALMSRSRYIDFVDTYAAAYRKSVFIDNRGFDAAFPGDSSGEDQELSFRLSKHGHKLVFMPTAIVYHHHPASMLAYAQRKFKTGYWKALVLRLHPEKAVRDTHTPGSLKLQMLLLAATPPIVLLGALLHAFVPALAAMLILLGASYAPFILRAWRRDAPVVLISPLMLTLRALALGTGLAIGVTARCTFRLPKSVQVGRGPPSGPRPE